MWYTDGFLIFLVLLAIPFVGGPLLILGTFHLKCPTRIVYFDEATLSLPREVSDFLVPTRNDLQELGFRVVSHFCLPDLVANVQSISALLVNDSTKDSAMINCVYARPPGGQTKMKTKYVEFVSRFRDDSCLQTNNSTEMSGFRAPPTDHTVQFWDVDDVHELYRRHRQIGERLSASRPWLALVEKYRNDVEEFLQQAVLQQPADYQVEQGLLRRVADGYRATPKGAFLLTWQELWPWKLFRKWWRLHEARRWLSEIAPG